MAKSLNKNKVVLFDIDYTLFDTESFRSKLYQSVFASFGEKEEKNAVEEVYNSVTEEFGYFRPAVFIEQLAKRLNKQTGKKRALQALWKQSNFDGNFYDESVEVVEQLAKGVKVGIFSKGRKTWQKKKIAALAHVFEANHVHITISKHKTLPLLLKDYKSYSLYFVDDALDVLHTAKKLDKNVYTIWVKRGRYAKVQKPIEKFTPDATVSDLKKVVDIVKMSS